MSHLPGKAREDANSKWLMSHLPGKAREDVNSILRQKSVKSAEVLHRGFYGSCQVAYEPFARES